MRSLKSACFPAPPHSGGERLRPDERSSLHTSSLLALLHLATLTAAVRSGIRLAVCHEITGYKISAMNTDRVGRSLAHRLTLGEAVAWLDKYEEPTQ